MSAQSDINASALDTHLIYYEVKTAVSTWNTRGMLVGRLNTEKLHINFKN